MAQVEFELAYYDSTVHHFIHNNTKTFRRNMKVTMIATVAVALGTVLQCPEKYWIWEKESKPQNY